MEHERAAFLASIIAQPEDDLPRLAFADFLQEQGNDADDARAKFIRIQIAIANEPEPTGDDRDEVDAKWKLRENRLRALVNRENELLNTHAIYDWLGSPGDLEPMTKLNPLFHGCDCGWRSNGDARFIGAKFRRGFISEVSLPLAAFLWGECRGCGGMGRVEWHWSQATTECPTCKGSGRTHSYGKLIAATNPVEEWVISDKTPYALSENRSGWYLSRHAPDASELPQELWGLLGGYNCYGGEPTACKWYPAREASLAALSDACNRYVRQPEPVTRGDPHADR